MNRLFTLNIFVNNYLKNFVDRFVILRIVLKTQDTSRAGYKICDAGNVSSVFNKNIVLAFLLFTSSLPFSTNVYSAAGDIISSTSTVDYVIGGTIGSSSSTSSFVEDRIINFFVSEADGGLAVPVISDMTKAVMQFTVTNTSNDVHDFLLTARNTSPNPFGLPVDSFDPIPTSIQVFVESGVTPGYQPLEDTAVYIDELAINVPQLVYVVADMPTLVLDDVSAIALIAQIADGGAAVTEGTAINADDNGHISPAGVFSNGGTTVAAGTPNTVPDSPLTMETVFNDQAGLNPEDISTDGSQDVANNGQHVDAGAYQASSPVTIVKTLTVVDTVGGSDPHPGATLRYQLVVSVSGNTAVDNLIITDVIPANTSYTDASILLNGIAQTDADDAPTDFSRAIDITSKPVVSIEVDLSLGGTVAVTPGTTNTIIFEVTID